MHLKYYSMQNRFSSLVLLGGILFFVVIYLFHLVDLVKSENEIYIRFFSLGLFILGVLLLLTSEIKKFHLPFSDIVKNNTLVIIPLVFLLIATIFHRKVGIYATGFFVLMSLVHLVLNKKLYKLNKLYYFLFGYFLLLFFGTISTPKGFHFPELTYTFLVVPISFCFFNLSHDTLIRIARVFFRIMTIYLMVCVLYWWYNFLHLDVDFMCWITQKKNIVIWMADWEPQIRLVNGITFPVYFFVNSWAYYSHPSYISLVLFFGLITGFYLYHKKDKQGIVSKFELTLYVVLCLFVEALMESRIGFVGCVFILAATGLYYAKIRLKMFKVAIIVYIIVGGGALLFMQDTVQGFIGDKARSTYSTLAIHYIEDHFWWGAGTQQQHVALKYQEEKMKDTIPPVERKIVYTHNQFLGNMVQYGIWGFIALVLLLYIIILYSIKERSYLLQMLMAVFILFMMIEEPLYTQEGITRFTVFLVFFVAISESKKDRTCIDLSRMLNKNRLNQLYE